jgi:hypothetical protein
VSRIHLWLVLMKLEWRIPLWFRLVKLECELAYQKSARKREVALLKALLNRSTTPSSV